MFDRIPQPILDRMQHLEAVDARDRADSTPRSQRLRQIPPETGRFLALLAATAPAGDLVEIGTSAGYSTLWLALACLETGRRIRTHEFSPRKAALARETFRLAQVSSLVDLVEGDARDHLPALTNIPFCFLDAEKEIYLACYEVVVPRLAPGGLFIADNALSHAEALRPFIERALADPRLDALVAPVGKGLLVGRKTGR